MQVRPAAVAGSFYPADQEQLRRQLADFMRPEVLAPVARTPVPRALVVPHAGYMYSGQLAGLAWSRLMAGAPDYGCVLLVGPAHRLALQGCALPDCQALATPLGQIAIAETLYQRARVLNHVAISDEAHRLEHSLEVQLPFIQQCLPDARVLPLLVGRCDAADVAVILDNLWTADTLLVVSSDLSHFHSYPEACRRDARTCEKILARDCHLTGEEACGCRALNGFLLLATQRGLQGQLLGVCNSGDTAGDKARVVGYGAFAFH